MHPSYDYRIERHIDSLLTAGANVTYINLSPESDPSLPISHARLRYRHIRVARRTPIRLAIGLLTVIQSYLRSAHTHVFVMDLELLLPVMILPRIMTRRVVLDIHELLSGYSRLRSFIIRRTWKKTSADLCLAIQQRLPRIVRSSKRVSVLENLPLARDFPAPDLGHWDTREKLIVYVGMLTDRVRRTTVMLAALNRVLDTHQSCRVAVLGKIPRIEKGKQLRREYGRLRSRDRTWCPGAVSHKVVCEQLSKATHGIMLVDFPPGTSISPNKLYEYMAAGTIVVTNYTSYSPPVPDSLMVVVDANIGADDLANVLLQTIDNAGLGSMAHAARDHVVNSGLFWERYLPWYKEVFAL